MIGVRPGRRGDAAAIAAVDAATSATNWSEAVFEAELARDDRRYLVAIAAPADGAPVSVRSAPPADGAEVVGYGALALLAGEGHVLGLAVGPDRRRQGVGRQLLEGLLTSALHAGVRDVTLEVRPSNTAARALYRLVGFDAAGRRPGYYPDGEDALILWRRGADDAAGVRATTNQFDREGA